MIYSPLEQFEIIPLVVIEFLGINLSFTNSSLFILLTVSIAFGIFYVSTKSIALIPGKWFTFVEMIYDFVLTLVMANVGKKGLKYFPFVFVLFTFIATCNVLGMIPYSFTPTSHITVTFALSFMVFVGVTIIGFVRHKVHFFSFFLPDGAPLALAPLLVGIELISYISRAFSLAIRLFANMMAGHTLLKIIAGFSVSMLSMNGFIYIAGYLPIALLFVLTGLEIGIAILQAYVFTVLTCIYLSDAIHLH